MEHPKIPKWEGLHGERYVYAHYFDQDPAYEFLHDLESDPDQLNNLATDPEYNDLLLNVSARFNELKKNRKKKSRAGRENRPSPGVEMAI